MSYICLDLASRGRVEDCTGSSGFNDTHRLMAMSIMFRIKFVLGKNMRRVCGYESDG
jgi:hypothetical protein